MISVNTTAANAAAAVSAAAAAGTHACCSCRRADCALLLVGTDATAGRRLHAAASVRNQLL